MNIQDFIKRVGIANHGELAKKVGVSKKTVDSWSSGDRTPTFEVCQKLLDLGMTVEELFGKQYRVTANAADEDFTRKATYFVNKLFEHIDKL